MNIYDKYPDAESEAYRTDSRPASSAVGAYGVRNTAASDHQDCEYKALYASAENVAHADIKQCIIAGKVLCPIEYKVIVKPDLIEDTDDVIKAARAVGIELPEAQKEKEKNRQISGTLVAIGGKAFEDMGDPMPKVGDKVYFARYAGIVLESDDKTDFRLCNDKDISGVLV